MLAPLPIKLSMGCPPLLPSTATLTMGMSCRIFLDKSCQDALVKESPILVPCTLMGLSSVVQRQKLTFLKLRYPYYLEAEMQIANIILDHG